MSKQNQLSRREFVGGVPMVAAGALIAGGSQASHAAEPARRKAAEPLTLFAFDNVSIPFQQNLRVQMHQPKKHPKNPVMDRGKPGEPDEFRAQFYGSIIREGGKFRMWFIAIDHAAIEKHFPKQAYRGCGATVSSRSTRAKNWERC